MVINILKAGARLAGMLALMAYTLVTRTWVFITALWTIVYFVMAAPQVTQFITSSMKLAVPGPLTIGRIQPTINPTNLDFWDVNFSRPNNQRVIHIDHLRVNLNPLPLILFLTGAKKRLVLSFDRIILDGFDVVLPFDKNYKFVFLDTFLRHHKHTSEKTGKTGPLLIFHNVIAHKGRVSLRLGSWVLNLQGLDFETDFSVDIGRHPIFRMDVRNLTATKGTSDVAGCPLGPKACKQQINNMKVRHFHMLDNALSFNAFSLEIPRGFIKATGEIAFPRGVGIKYRGKASIRLDDPDYLRDLSRGALSGPVFIRAGGEGTMANPTFFAMVKSKGLNIPGLDGPKVFHGDITGVKTGSGNYNFIVQDAELKDKNTKITLHRLVLNPFIKGLVRQADISFRDLSSGYLALAPKWLALPKKYSGKLRIDTMAKGRRRIKLDLKTMFDRPGLFASGPMSISLQTSIDRDLSKLRVKRLHLHRSTDNITFKGQIDLDDGALAGVMDMDWDVSGISAMLNQKIMGTLHSRHMRISGHILSPILEGQVSSPNIAPGAKSYAIKADCRVSVRGLACSSLRIVGNNSVFIGRGFGLDAWRRFRLKTGKGVLDLGLLHQGLAGRMSVDLQGLSFPVQAPLKGLDGSLKVWSGRVSTKNMVFSGLKGHVKASRGAIEVKSIRFGIGGGHVSLFGTLGRDLDTFKGTVTVRNCDISEMKLFRDSQGILNGRLVLEKSKGMYKPFGKLSVSSARWGAADLGNINMIISPGAKGFINLTGSAMNGALNLSSGSGILIKKRALQKVVLRGSLHDVDIGAFVGSGWPESLKTTISANLDLGYSLVSGSLSGRIDVPKKGLKMSFIPAEQDLYSSGFSLQFLKNVFHSQGLVLNDGKKSVKIDIKGGQSFKRLAVYVQGALGMYFLRYFKDAVLDTTGYINLAMHINKGPSGYTMRGQAITDRSTILVKDLADEIQLKPGGMIKFQDTGGKTRVWVDEDHRVSALVGNGSAALWGSGLLRNGHLVQSQMHMDGLNLKIASQGYLWMNITPQLDMIVANGHRSISGIIKISEGAFTKDYSKFMGLSYQSRSTSLLDRFPWLASTGIKLRIEGKNFKVRSKFPLGKTDMTLNMDLNLRGSLGSPLVYNRVEIVPGSTIFYNLVTRRFNVVRGILQFNGPLEHPNIDLQAQTKVNYHRKGRQSSVIQSRFIAEALETDDIRNESQITINLQVKGLFPDLSVALSSNARDMDQLDLEYLLLTGMTRQDIGSGSGSLNVGMLTEGLSGILAKALMTPIFDVASIGIQPNGGFTADVSLKLGHNLSLMTSVEQSSTFSRYSAGFRFRLTEHLTLEGFVRSVEMSPDPSEVGRRYESKLRYRIPLE